MRVWRNVSFVGKDIVRDIMKIVVCIKQVPYLDQIKFDYDSKRVIREGVESQINPFDKRALTYAIQMKNTPGAETIALTMGPPQAANALREALAMGIDRAVHLVGPEFAGADTLATARALARAIEILGYDLVLCGKYATDAETAQVPPMLAEMLGIPQVTSVTLVEWNGDTFTAKRELDTGFETLRGKLPALMTAGERLAKPINATPQDLERVKDAPIETITPAQLGDAAQFGLAGSPTWVESIEAIVPNRKKIIRQTSDGPEKVVRETVDDLMREGLLGEWEAHSDEGIDPGAVREDSGKAYWVWAEVVEGAVRPVTFELLGRAVQLAGESGGNVAAVVIGPNVKQHAATLAAHGADKVYVAESEALPEYATEPFARVLSETIAQYTPFTVLLPSTANGRDLAPRVAARLGVGLTGDILDLSLDAQDRVVQLKPAFGGNIVAPILTRTIPVMATVRPGMLEPTKAKSGRQAPVIEIPVTDATSRLEIVGGEKTTDEGVHLDDAAIVIGIGTGVGGEANLPKVEELCRVVDGHFGATRKVVDQGWLPRQLQIGLTGRTVSPHLYIALGIKGSFNHTVGIQRAGTILAINNDPNADIFKIADYGIIGDWQEIVNDLIRVVEEKKREQGKGDSL